MADSSQKFIARNRAPRVQIEYEVELYGAQKAVQLPFVMGVMADLAGKSQVPQPDIADRGFLQIDVDNFDARMRGIAPRAAFSVPNTLTGEGQLPVDLTFTSMADFTPEGIARRVPALRALLEAREQLAVLMAYMDGKSGAEELIGRILADPALLRAVGAAATPAGDDSAAALASLKAAAPGERPADDLEDTALAALRAAASVEAPAADPAKAALDALRAAAPNAAPAADPAAAALAALRAAAPSDAPAADSAAAALEALRAAAPAAPVAGDVAAAALANLRATPPDEAASADDTSDALAALRAAVEPDAPEADHAAAALAALKAAAPAAHAAEDPAAAALTSLRAPVPEAETPDPSAALDALRAAARADEGGEDAGDDSALEGLRAAAGPADGEATDGASDALEALRSAAPVEARDEAAEAALAALRAAPLHKASVDDPSADALAALRAAMPAVPPVGTADAARGAMPEGAAAEGDLDDLLGGLGDDLALPAETGLAQADDGLDDLLGDLAEPPAVRDEAPPALDDLDDLLGDLSDPLPLQADAATAAPAAPAAVAPMAPADDLDDLLGGFEEPSAPATAAEAVADDLDDLLGDAEVGDDLDDLLGAAAASQEAGEDLDDLLAGLDDPAPAQLSAALAVEPPRLVTRFGTVSQAPALPARAERTRFRIALLGDFTGRAARGVIEAGDALAARPGQPLDPDSIDEIIAGFAATLVLPFGENGEGIEIRLESLDDLHPDALYAKLPLFAELRALRQSLAAGGQAAGVAARLEAWGAAHGQPLAPPRRSAEGVKLRADLRLSDFQRLIGGAAPAPAPLDGLLERIVGPHVRQAPGQGAGTMLAAVDAALSGAMRMILHHPDFQALEAQWRSLDLLARSIETDDRLEVVLYDVSAEELAVDLTGADDLSGSGLLRLLTGPPLDPETGRGPFSAVIGLYAFEETPPHAELLGRIAQVAASADAPFVAAISPGFLGLPKDERHPLTAEAWDSLRALPQAGYVGLVSPRFLLRHPYGAKTDPIDAFRFEEFTLAEGLGGMVWANPAVLAAILMARSFRENGRTLKLGSIMTLGDVPFHVVTDPQGDQVALPATEALVTLDGHRAAVQRGYMPVMAVKGRNEVRLGSFNGLGGGELRGYWSAEPPPAATAGGAAPALAPAEDALADLDALLAGFDDAGPATAQGDDAIDAALADLLNDL